MSPLEGNKSKKKSMTMLSAEYDQSYSNEDPNPKSNGSSALDPNLLAQEAVLVTVQSMTPYGKTIFPHLSPTSVCWAGRIHQLVQLEVDEGCLNREGLRCIIACCHGLDVCQSALSSG